MFVFNIDICIQCLIIFLKDIYETTFNKVKTRNEFISFIYFWLCIL